MSPSQLRDMQQTARNLKIPTHKSYLADHSDIGDRESDRADNIDSKLSDFKIAEKPISQTNTHWVLDFGATIPIAHDGESLFELNTHSAMTLL